MKENGLKNMNARNSRISSGSSRELAELENKALEDAWKELMLVSGGYRQAEKTAGLSFEALSDPCTAVVEMLAARQGMKLACRTSSGQMDTERQICRLLEDSMIYYRRFRLEKDALASGCTDFIAFRRKPKNGDSTDDAGSSPVAFMAGGDGSFQAYDPENGHRWKPSSDDLPKFMPYGYEIYPQFQTDKVSWSDLLILAMRGLRRDFSLAFILGSAGGILSVAQPYAVGLVFGSIIPQSDHVQLIQVGIVLATAAAAAALFNFLRSMMVLRMKTRMDYRLQAAIIGRLLKLPPAFFRRYPTGDLAQRVMGVGHIRSTLADSVTNAVFALVFAIPNFLLMFWFSGRLAAVATAALFCQVLIILLVSVLNFRNQSKMMEADGELSGFVLQIIRGIAKVRHSVSEERVFVKWAAKFARGLGWRRKAVANSNFMAVFDSACRPLVLCLFFLLAGGIWRGSLEIGGFLGFISSFTAFITAILACSSAFSAIVAVLPLLFRMSPFLNERPEAGTKRMPELDGRIELSRVSCRYSADTPLVLKDVSISVSPGEFVAIAGPSGAGKSTIVRLLLGFENPESGSVLFSGQDISEVSKHDLRSQIGIVLQLCDLTEGSIYENIAGNGRDLSMDSAWEAARLAGCDEDIRKMPMGMHTMLGHSSLSGGQKQRLLVARALARKPRVLIFDEATSSLDNQTQAQIAANLEAMRTTRIVIAHRLSTIRKADRIYVLDSGRIVEVGTFNELIKQPGVFQRLAERQML